MASQSDMSFDPNIRVPILPLKLVVLIGSFLFLGAYFAIEILNASFSLGLPGFREVDERPGIVWTSWAFLMLAVFSVSLRYLFLYISGKLGFTITNDGIHVQHIGIRTFQPVGWEHIVTVKRLDPSICGILKLELDKPLLQITGKSRFARIISKTDPWPFKPVLFLYETNDVSIDELEQTIAKYRTES